jgi:thioredoxin 1
MMNNKALCTPKHRRATLLTPLMVLLLLTATPSNAWRITQKRSHNREHKAMLLRVSNRMGRDMPLQLLSRDGAGQKTTSTSLHASMKFRTFEEMLTQFTDTPVVVNFHNSLCGPCRLMKKELNVVSDTLKEDIKMFAVDTELYPKLGQRYEVSGLPTVMIFHRGTVRERIEGLHSSDEIIKRIQGLLL